MAKHQRQTKQSGVVGRHGRGVSFEQHENIDDSVFAGATIIFAANSFLNFRKKNNINPKDK